MTVVKLALNPYEPNHKTFGPFRLMVHAPFTTVANTKHLPLTLADLLPDEPEENFRTVFLSFLEPNVNELEFNLNGSRRHQIQVGDQEFLITLLEIGEEEHPREPGKKFLYFYFEIQEVV
jgi:hypothetical protein